MKATVDIPDNLYRRVKARAALEGRTVREVTTELYRQWLEEEPAPTPPHAEEGDPREAWLSGWEELGRQISAEAVDPRTTREIVLEDRR